MVTLAGRRRRQRAYTMQFKRTYYEQIPERCDPAVKALFAEMLRQKTTLTVIADRSGITRAALCNWREKNTPNISNLRAALNVLGLDLKVVPMRNSNDSEKEVNHGEDRSDDDAHGGAVPGGPLCGDPRDGEGGHQHADHRGQAEDEPQLRDPDAGHGHAADDAAGKGADEGGG